MGRLRAGVSALEVSALGILALAACLGCRGPASEPAVPERVESTLVSDPVLIRADKWTEWHYVGRFIEQARGAVRDPSDG